MPSLQKRRALSLRRIGTCFIALTVSFLNVAAQQIDRSARPSFSLSIVEGLAENAGVDLANYRIDGSALADRAFVDVVQSVRSSDIGLSKGGLDAADSDTEFVNELIKDWAVRTRHSEELIRHLFMIDDDFTWKNERLVERAEYSQTQQEALVEVATVRGGLASAGDRALDQLTRVYSLVLLPVVDQKNVQRKVDGKTVTVQVTERKVYAALLKLPFANVEEAGIVLGPVYCEAGCSDREERQQRFSDLDLEMVMVWSTKTTMNDKQKLAGVIHEVLDDIVRSLPALQIRSFIVSTEPIRARIGRKEGVSKGRRYQAVRQLEVDGIRKSDIRGYVRAYGVVNNMRKVTRVTAEGREELESFDTSVFKQIHGTGIDPMDVLVEKPDLGLDVMGAYRTGTYTSISIETMYRPPGIFATMAGVGLEVFTESSEGLANELWFASSEDLTDWTMYRGEVFMAHDMMLLNGNVRVTPMLGLFYQYASPIDAEENDEVSISSIGARISVMGTLLLAPNLGLFARIGYQSFGGSELNIGESKSEIDWDEYFETGKGAQLSMGVRLSF